MLASKKLEAGTLSYPPTLATVLLHPGNLELKGRAGARKSNRRTITNASFQGILRR